MRYRFALVIPLLVSAIPTAVHTNPCTLPVQYAHTVSQIEETIRVTLATQRDTYTVGDSVACYLMFENIGDSTYVIPNPSSITPFHSFWILPDTCEVPWQDGCAADLLLRFPEVVFFFGVPLLLDPGECVSYEVAWDGITPYGGLAPPGSYAVVGGMTSGGRIFFPDGGLRLFIAIQDLVPRWPSTWSEIKVRYGN